MNDQLITMTAEIVSAHVSNNAVAIGDMAALIGATYATLATLGEPAKEPEQELLPAVPIRASVRPDYIICLEDGKRLKMLKRHLMSHYQMTPEQYRRRWSLPADYPMTAANYSAQRRNLAIHSGLGRKGR